MIFEYILNTRKFNVNNTAQNMKYNIKDFFSKCDQFEVGWDVPSRANPGKYHTTLF